LFAAAVPCLTTLAAVPLLSERPTVTAVAGVAVVTVGMVVAARMRSGGPSTPHTPANHSYPLSSQ
jgi:drug/metabolite transporter (DMT)-like permease